MKLGKKNIPKKVLKQIRYVKEKETGHRSYRIVNKDGSLDPVHFHSIIGAAASIMGVWDILE